MTNAIEVRGLTKSYGDFALRDLTFSLPSGSILGLVGENGAGKSTTIGLLLGAIDADAGSAAVLGTDVRDPAYPQTRQDLGVVLDEATFPEIMTARQVGKLMALTYRNWQPGTYADLLRRFDLPDQKAFKDFSRGMKMKLALAVALSHEAKLLLLDEATGGLDPMVREEILDLLLDFARDEDHSVLLSSHIVSDLEKVCDYIAFLHKGRLLLFEEKDRLLDDYAVVSLSRADRDVLDPDAVLGVREEPYSLRALVRRDAVPAGFTAARPDLEEIILFLARRDRT